MRWRSFARTATTPAPVAVAVPEPTSLGPRRNTARALPAPGTVTETLTVRFILAGAATAQATREARRSRVGSMRPPLPTGCSRTSRECRTHPCYTASMAASTAEMAEDRTPAFHASVNGKVSSGFTGTKAEPVTSAGNAERT